MQLVALLHVEICISIKWKYFIHLAFTYLFIFFTGEQHLKIRIIALGENILGKQQTIIFLNKSHFVFDSKNKWK